MSGTYFITSYVVNNRGKLSQFKTYEINKVFSRAFYLAYYGYENNVLYVTANLSNDTVYADIDLEDNISGFGYSELEKSVLLSNLVYRILEDYTKFMFCKNER